MLRVLLAAIRPSSRDEQIIAGVFWFALALGAALGGTVALIASPPSWSVAIHLG